MMTRDDRFDSSGAESSGTEAYWQRRENIHGRRIKDHVLPAEIPDIGNRWSCENDEAVENIVQRHRRDDLIGIAYVVFGRNGRHEYRVSGQCASHPEMTVGMLTRMQWALMAQQELGD